MFAIMIIISSYFYSRNELPGAKLKETKGGGVSKYFLVKLSLRGGIRLLFELSRHERHLGDDGLARAPAHEHLDLGAGLVRAVPDVAHGDVLAEGRAGTAAGDDAEGLVLAVAGGGDDLGALARGRALDDEPDAPPRDAAAALALGRQLGEDGIEAVELVRVGRGAPPVLAHDPAQRGLDGRRRVVDVVSVQAHAGLEPQAVPRPEARELQPLGPRGGEQRLGHGHGVGGRNGDLEAVLARVPGPADEHRIRGPLDLGKAALAEVQLGQVRLRRVLEDQSEDFLGERALERDQPPSVEDLVADFGAVPGRQLLLEVGEVLLPTAGVGHDVEELGPEACDDGVVDDTARLRPQQRRQPALVRRQGLQAARRDPLQKRRGARALESMLHHVAHVEERGLLAGELVRGAHAQPRVLHGHLEAAERHHLGAVGEVEVIEGSLLERCVGRGGRGVRSPTLALRREVSLVASSVRACWAGLKCFFRRYRTGSGVGGIIGGGDKARGREGSLKNWVCFS